MSEQISWIAELSINAGEIKNLRILMQEMVEDTAKEPGAIVSQWFISEDEGICHIYECYKNSDATASHIMDFKRNYAARIMALGKTIRLVVYGKPDSAVQEDLNEYNAVYMAPMGGFMW